MDILKSYKYYLKFAFLFVFGSLLSLIMLPYFAFHWKDIHNMICAAKYWKLLNRPLGIKWKIRGREHLEKDQACIIIANHQSSIDVMGMFQVWHIMKKCIYVVKKELLYFTGPFGICIFCSRIIPIDRNRPEEAMHTLSDEIKPIKNEKLKLWIYAEGTRRNTGQIHEFKKGAFLMAVNSQLPILPIVFSRHYFLSDGETKRFDEGTVIITVLPPIPTEGLLINDIPRLIKKSRNLMNETFQCANREIRLYMEYKAPLQNCESLN